MKPALLITGVSGGIGNAIAEEFTARGFQIFGVDILPSIWTDWESIDLADGNFLTKLEEKFDFANLSCIVHAAADQPLGPIHTHSRRLWEETLWTNFLALDGLVKHLHTKLSKNLGSVVLIGSVHARLTRQGMSAYSVSKAAAQAWIKSAAIDYAPAIRINSVMPGAINSMKLYEARSTADVATQARFVEELRSRTPLERIGAPKDVAQAVAFLAGTEASFITGQTLVVDGGATLLLGTETGNQHS
jgi:NAD(P)-dependent dehydrogenase (short-subunit alcohol dehydrogenase family)